MAWATGSVQFEKTEGKRDTYEGDIQITKVDDLVLHGVVLDSEEKTPVPGALVKVFARMSNGNEEPLCHSFCSGEGHYLLHVSKKKIPADTAAIIVRAIAQ